MIDHDAIESAKRRSLGQVLMRTARLFNEESLARVRAATGHPVQPAHVALFPHIDLGGTRATEIAARMGVTKQAVGPYIRDLVAWGFLERVPDPADGRASLLRFSEQEGRTLLDGLGVLFEVEQALAASLGVDRIERLLADLHALEAAISALDASDDVVDRAGP